MALVPLDILFGIDQIEYLQDGMTRWWFILNCTMSTKRRLQDTSTLDTWNALCSLSHSISLISLTLPLSFSSTSPHRPFLTYFWTSRQNGYLNPWSSAEPLNADPTQLVSGLKELQLTDSLQTFQKNNKLMAFLRRWQFCSVCCTPLLWQESRIWHACPESQHIMAVRSLTVSNNNNPLWF